LHLLALRKTPSVQDASFAFACSTFLQQRPLEATTLQMHDEMLPELKLPLLNCDIISQLSEESLAECDSSVLQPSQESAASCIPLSDYVALRPSSLPSFQTYESKFRFLDAQIPLVLRPAAPCVFASAISATHASARDSLAPGNAAAIHGTSAVVHPCSLSPSRHVKVEVHDKRPNSASVRPSTHAKRLKKTSAAEISGEQTACPADPNGSRTATKSSAVARAAAQVKVANKSPAYELLKSKLWSKLHSKFRREAVPAIDVDLLKIVFNW
jgi:hypothetical protein